MVGGTKVPGVGRGASFENANQIPQWHGIRKTLWSLVLRIIRGKAGEGFVTLISSGSAEVSYLLDDPARWFLRKGSNLQPPD